MPVFVSVLCLGVTVFLWMLLYARFKKMYSPDATVEKAGKVLNKMLIDLNSNAERNITLINDRIAELKRVITEADKRIADFESREIPHEEEPEAVVSPVAEPESVREAERDYRQEVRKLAALGMTVDEIADEVGLSTQEVKFTLEFS